MKKTKKTETVKPKAAKPPSTSALAKRVRRVAALMQKLGADMDYYGGFGEVGQHGREMQGAARIALGWADGMERAPITRSRRRPVLKLSASKKHHLCRACAALYSTAAEAKACRCD